MSGAELRAVWEAATEPVFGLLVRFLDRHRLPRRARPETCGGATSTARQKLWTLPTTKAGHGDEKPLSDLALSIIDEAKKQSVDRSEYVFSVMGGRDRRLRQEHEAAARQGEDPDPLDAPRPSPQRRDQDRPSRRCLIPSKPTIARVLGHAESGVTSPTCARAGSPESGTRSTAGPRTSTRASPGAK